MCNQSKRTNTVLSRTMCIVKHVLYLEKKVTLPNIFKMTKSLTRATNVK